MIPLFFYKCKDIATPPKKPYFYALAMGDNTVRFGYPCHLTTKKELAVKLYSDIIKQRTKHDKAFAKLIEQAQDKSKGLSPPKYKP